MAMTYGDIDKNFRREQQRRKDLDIIIKNLQDLEDIYKDSVRDCTKIEKYTKTALETAQKLRKEM